MASVDIQMVEREGVWSMRETKDQRIDRRAHEDRQHKRASCVVGVAVLFHCIGIFAAYYAAANDSVGDAAMVYIATTGIMQALASWAERIRER